MYSEDTLSDFDFIYNSVNELRAVASCKKAASEQNIIVMKSISIEFRSKQDYIAFSTVLVDLETQPSKRNADDVSKLFVDEKYSKSIELLNLLGSFDPNFIINLS